MQEYKSVNSAHAIIRDDIQSQKVASVFNSDINAKPFLTLLWNMMDLL